jgi:hypothetical protein
MGVQCCRRRTLDSIDGPPDLDVGIGERFATLARDQHRKHFMVGLNQPGKAAKDVDALPDWQPVGAARENLRGPLQLCFYIGGAVNGDLGDKLAVVRLCNAHKLSFL